MNWEQDQGSNMAAVVRTHPPTAGCSCSAADRKTRRPPLGRRTFGGRCLGIGCCPRRLTTDRSSRHGSEPSQADIRWHYVGALGASWPYGNGLPRVDAPRGVRDRAPTFDTKTRATLPRQWQEDRRARGTTRSKPRNR